MIGGGPVNSAGLASYIDREVVMTTDGEARSDEYALGFSAASS